MSFPHFCIYFRFKYTPLVNSTMVYEKGLFTYFWHREVSGKCFLEHFISNFHILPYNALQTCHFHIFVYISVSNIYPPGKFIFVSLALLFLSLYQIFTFSHILWNRCISVSNIVNSTMFYEKGLFTSFWHREVSGKVFLRALYIKFSHFPINVLLTCHFHIFVCFSVSNIPPFNYGRMWKFDIKCSKKHFPRNFSMPKRRK